MDKYQALQSFWSGFELEAYDENIVYGGREAPEFPYITYNVSTDSLDFPVPMSASLWYRSPSWEAISLKTEQIAKEIEENGVIPLDVGYLWIMKGTPFAQRMNDPSDSMIRRVYLNITAEYLPPH